MATFYWVGGSGTWDANTTTNWASSSGGAGYAGVPTSADDVVFDANSGGTAFVVTVQTGSVCNDLTAGSLSASMTLQYAGSSTDLYVYGSMTLPATNFTWGAASGVLYFKSTTTGKTVTTNGVLLGNTSIYFDGVGGEWTLGSALTTGTNGTVFRVNNGSFDTANYSIQFGGFNSNATGTRNVNFGSSAISS